MSGLVWHAGADIVTWQADVEAALGPISLEINELRIILDASRPYRPIGVVGDRTRWRDATTLFADPSVVPAVLDAGDGEVVPDPVLNDAAARAATVRCVEAMHLGDLDDGVLLLDRALAGDAVGARDALRAWGYAAAVPERIVDEIENSDHQGVIVERMLEVVGATPGEVMSVAQRNSLTTILASRASRRDLQWDIFLAETVLPDQELAFDLGGTAAPTTYLADLGLVPPRILVFGGPESAEVTAVETPAGTIAVSAPVRTDSFAAEYIRDGIFAIAADPDSGEIVAFAPAVLAEGEFHATIRPPGVEVVHLRVAFVGADADLSTVRLDPTGVALSRIDRHCRHAWTCHRLAGALRAAAGIGDTGSQLGQAAESADAAQRDSETSMVTAKRLLARLERRHRAGPQHDAITRYAHALDMLQQFVDGPPVIDGPTGPTLAELHAVALR